jgi:hypothetical protein
VLDRPLLPLTPGDRPRGPSSPPLATTRRASADSVNGRRVPRGDRGAAASAFRAQRRLR